VPEHASSHARLPPASLSRSTPKGKERERRASNEPVRNERAEWVIDLLETQRGSEGWVLGDRVILVLGSKLEVGSSLL
jgi:hypothetical protein